MHEDGNELVDEEDSLRLLKGQLSQLQAIRVDNEQKEMLISKLKLQVNELSALKEATLNMKSQISSLEKHVKDRDSELKRRSSYL